MPEESDRIVVSKDRLAHCTWCGSPQSNEWVFSDKGDIFCTHECMLAANVRKTWFTSIAMLSCSIIVLVPYMIMFVFGFLGSGFFGIEFLIYGIAFIILSIVGFAYTREGKKYQDRKGKYSGVPPLKCEFCNHPNPPNATRCLNCDATLANAPFDSDAIPPWIYPQKKVKGVKCPHCNAVYSYLPSMIMDDKQVACQNCNRKFFIPFAPLDSSLDMKRAQY